MRRLLLAGLLALPLVAVAGNTQTVLLDVQNMTCPVCPITVRKALDKVPGVSEAKVDYTKKTATVRFDPDQANTAMLVEATTNAGYPRRLTGEP